MAIIIKESDNRIRISFPKKDITSAEFCKAEAMRGVQAVEQIANALKGFTRGERGLTGLKGDTGLTGEKGDTGLTGERGDTGKDGRGIKLITQPTDDTMEIGLTDGTTITLDLPRGVDGREIELRATQTHIQWRYIGDADWRNLLLLAGLITASEGAGSLHINLRMLEDIDWASMQDGYILSYNQAGDNFIWIAPSAGIADSFETVSKNLLANAYAFNYTGDLLTSIDYTGGITKTFSYTGDLLTQIVLSGSTPAGIDTIKSFTYDVNDNLTNVVYS